MICEKKTFWNPSQNANPCFFLGHPVETTKSPKTVSYRLFSEVIGHGNIMGSIQLHKMIFKINRVFKIFKSVVRGPPSDDQ